MAKKIGMGTAVLVNSLSFRIDTQSIHSVFFFNWNKDRQSKPLNHTHNIKSKFAQFK